MISGMIPENADFLMYISHDHLGHRELELFKVDEDILLKLEIGKRPSGYESLGIFKQEVPDITKSELLETIGVSVNA